MERKTLLYWSAQIIGWGAYFVLSVLLLYSTNELFLTLNLAIYIVSSIGVSIFISHTLRYVILHYNLLGHSLIKLIVWVLGLAVIAATVLELFQYSLTEYGILVDFVDLGPTPTEQSFDWANFSFAVFRSVLLFLIWTGFYLAYIFIEQSRNQEMQRLKLDASANEIELKNLRAQLNPHFMFNSLNSIRALVGLDPEQAKTAITRLSSLLRHSINLGKQKLVKLEDEIELVKNYLELEKIRFEERLQIDYQMSESTFKCLIPPLMLQTIVENSIKHGVSASIEGGTIVLDSKMKDKSLVITVTNPGKLSSGIAENGIGVANTKKRLEILYGNKGSFEIKQQADKVIATIKIDYS
jgi:two-component system, LytTR family, sensor kinase